MLPTVDMMYTKHNINIYISNIYNSLKKFSVYNICHRQNKTLGILSSRSEQKIISPRFINGPGKCRVPNAVPEKHGFVLTRKDHKEVYCFVSILCGILPFPIGAYRIAILQTFQPSPTHLQAFDKPFPFFSSLQTLIHFNLITQEITECAENKVEKRKQKRIGVPVPVNLLLWSPLPVSSVILSWCFVENRVVCIVKPLDVVLKRRDWKRVSSLLFTRDFRQTNYFVLFSFVHSSY